MDNVITDGEWYEAEHKVAIEKVKQALREKHAPSIGASNKPKKTIPAKLSAENAGDISLSPSGMAASRSPSSENSSLSRDPAFVVPVSPSSNEAVALQDEHAFPAMASSLLPSMFAATMRPASVDASLLLYQSALFQQPLVSQPNLLLPPQYNQSLQHPYGMAATRIPETSTSAAEIPQELLQELQQSMNATATANTASRLEMYSRFHNSFHHQSASAAAPRQPMDLNENCQDLSIVSTEEHQNEDNIASIGVPSASIGVPSASVKEDDVAAFVLSSLAITDRPVVTDEQEALELATLSDEEKAAILVDSFANFCSVSGRQSKRARKDLDADSTAFLVRLMKIEIESIPVEQKSALVEAQAKARPDEFSDARLERFLRREGMNAKVRMAWGPACVSQKTSRRTYLLLTCRSWQPIAL